MKKTKRIGLFGGTFDPPHRAHIHIAKIALKKCELDLVIFIPCHYPPLEKGFTPAPKHHRLKMLKLLLQNASKKKFKISTVELTRRQKKSYSYVTAEYFHKKYPRAKLFWIIGSDQWDDIENWENLPRLAQLATFIIFPRPRLAKPKKSIPSISLKTKPVNISSTKIREMIRQHKQATFFLAAPVLRYLQKQKIYLK